MENEKNFKWDNECVNDLKSMVFRISFLMPFVIFYILYEIEGGYDKVHALRYVVSMMFSYLPHSLLSGILNSFLNNDPYNNNKFQRETIIFEITKLIAVPVFSVMIYQFFSWQAELRDYMYSPE